MEIDVKRVASLAKIKLLPSEMDEIEEDLRTFLRRAEALAKAEMVDCEPTYALAEFPSPSLETDVPGPTLDRDEVLGLFPHSKDGFALVPKSGEEV